MLHWLFPVGTQIHNIEITKGKGGQMLKSTGTIGIVFGREYYCIW